jgi:hypothetical protein
VNKGGLLAAFLGAATVALVVIGTMYPSRSALAYTGGQGLMRASSTPEEAVQTLGDEIRIQSWQRAYDSLANKAEFTEQEFVHDLTGYYPCLRTYGSVDHVEVFPLHASDNEADVRMKLYWSTVVGTSVSTRDLHVVRNGDHWAADWPIVKKPDVPPQDVEAPHVRIVDMHPVQRAEGVVILGEMLNEDVVPAYVSVSATLLGKNQAPIATEGSFDKISHLLLPKQVTPFFINFPNATLSDVQSVRMTPFSTLVSASADPVIEIDNEKLNSAPDASLTGQVINQSGKVVNVAHVLGTFYDSNGHVVWVADQYIDRALLPQTPAPFNIHIPEDLAKNISSERTVVASYTAGGSQ